LQGLWASRRLVSLFPIFSLLFLSLLSFGVFVISRFCVGCFAGLGIGILEREANGNRILRRGVLLSSS